MVAQWYHTHLPPLRPSVQSQDPMWDSWYFFTDGWQFTSQNLDQLYVLVSSAHKTTHRDMSFPVLKAQNQPK